MNDIVINLSEDYGSSLESKDLAIEIFEKIPNNIDKVTFNFQNVYHIGCFFVREFLLLEKNSSFEVKKEFTGLVDDTFNLVSKCDEGLSDEEFIEFLKMNV